MSEDTEQEPENSKPQDKTVFSILSNLKQNQTSENSENTFKTDSETDSIAILTKDPNTNQRFINKSIYSKLHRSLSPNRSIVVDKIKEKYESLLDNQSDNDENRKETLESIKNKYSPASLGYTKSKVPIPKPRRLIKSSTKKLNKSKEDKDFNSNNLKSNSNLEDIDETDDEFLTIVTRSDSEESVCKIQKELSIFTMDRKKRSNSFRKLFTGKFFGKDKKKNNEEINDTSLTRRAEISSENNQNECHQFSRNPRSAHDTNLTQQYPSFYNTRQPHQKTNDNRNQVPHGYVPMDKPMFKSNDPSVYIQLSDVRQYDDESSSASLSTLESERLHFSQNTSNYNSVGDKQFNSLSNKTNDYKRDTPPRALETRQDVRLVNPKALIPINSERSLPNPYQNVKERYNNSSPNGLGLAQRTPKQDDTKFKYLEDNYGTVFDSIEHQRQHENFKAQKPPMSPSLEPSKLKLPPNRTIVPLSPRIRSPIPQEQVSTEKIIATELLKPKRSPTPTRNVPKEHKDTTSRQPLPADRDYHRRNENSYHGKLPVEDIRPNSSFRRLDDSKSSNELSSPDRNSSLSSTRRSINSPVVKGYKIDFNSSCDTDTKDDIDDMSVKLRDKVTMSKTFTNSSTDNVNTRRFYEVGSISRPATREEKTVTPNNDFKSQAPLNYEYHSRLSTNSNESIIRRSREVIHSPSSFIRTPTPNKSNSSLQSVSMSPIKPPSGRSTTPLNSGIPESPKTTPQKEEIRKNIESYYWNEIRKLKDKENYNLYLYQLQYANLIPQNYVAEPDRASRSRSISPSNRSNTRRSLSLPRERRSLNTSSLNHSNVIREGEVTPSNVRPQQILLQENFIRNSPQRSTIDGSSRGYDNNSLYRPIFKRGSLSTPPKQTLEDPLKRKVSFLKNGQENVQSWPTKNGFTKSPPQRRLEKPNIQVDSNGARYDYPPDSVDQNGHNFEPIYSQRNSRANIYEQRRTPQMLQNVYDVRNGDQIILENPYGYKIERRVVVENPYERRTPSQHFQQNENVLYGQPVDGIKRGLTRHGSIQLHEDIYGYRNQIAPVRRVSHQGYVPVQNVSNQEPIYGSRRNTQPVRRQVIVQDEIYGQFVGYVPSNSANIVSQSSANVMEYNARVREQYFQKIPQKQVTVNQKVCDFYGQIHDMDSPRKLQANGVLMGQLQKNPTSPLMERNSYSQLPPNGNFVRNSRLTASANDMYKKVPNINRLNNETMYVNNNGQNMNRGEAIYGQNINRGEAIYGQNMQTSADMYKRMPNISENRINNEGIYGQNTNGAPTRPLPPIPPTKIKSLGRSVQVSDTESGSDASEIQRILNSKSKTNKKSIFRK